MTDAAEIQGADSASGTKEDKNSQHVKVGKYDVAIANNHVPLVGIIVSSLIFLVAIGVESFVEGYYKRYGLALGILSLVLALIQFIPAVDKHGVLINVFLFWWCFVGSCIMTFGSGPFTFTGNGYFASWAMTVFSGTASLPKVIPGEVTEATASPVMRSMLGLGACSIVSFIAIVTANLWILFRGEMVFGMIVCALTMLMVPIFAFGRVKNNATIKKMEFLALALLAVLWIFASCFITFRGPFLVTSNGYLASWGGTILVVKACMASKAECAHADTSTDEEG